MRDGARDPSMRDNERCRERPLKVADSPDGNCLAVTVKKGGGLRRRLRPRCSSSGDEKVDMTNSATLSFVGACIAIVTRIQDLNCTIVVADDVQADFELDFFFLFSSS